MSYKLPPGVTLEGFNQLADSTWEGEDLDPDPDSPDVLKVGKEGYVHGWVCVRPPCGDDSRLTLEPDNPVRVPGRGMVPSYRVVHSGTGEQVGSARPMNTDDGLRYVAANQGQERSNVSFASRPEAGLKPIARRHNLQLLSSEARNAGLTSAADAYTQARNALPGGNHPRDAEAYAADRLQHAAQLLDGANADPATLARLKNGTADLYHDLTGREISGAKPAIREPVLPPTARSAHTIEFPSGLTSEQEQGIKAEIDKQMENQAHYIPQLTRAHIQVLQTLPGATAADYEYGTNSLRLNLGLFDTMDDKHRNAAYLNSLHGQDKWHPPIGPGATLADADIAHEMGHAVESALGSHRTSPALWGKIAAAIGVNPPAISDSDPQASIQRWIGRNKAALKAGISEYATEPPGALRETLAELWQEYTTSPNPRAAAKAYGEYAARYV
jgi:hypothetical protein